jgi:hypothetical protein
MTIKIIDLTHRVGRVQVELPGVATEITIPEAVEALETLARILDFSLVDHVERQSLLELAEEVQAARGPYTIRDVAQAGVALADAVSAALRVENPQEV